ncbi:hypothetical protein M1146_06990 [Patescibacteria group bacterium]|nr:hypothetical protein [Patescibacteria group bacterium]
MAIFISVRDNTMMGVIGYEYKDHLVVLVLKDKEKLKADETGELNGEQQERADVEEEDHLLRKKLDIPGTSKNFSLLYLLAILHQCQKPSKKLH